MKAFYFSRKDKRLRYGDNRTIRTGLTHKVKGEIKLCNNGLHASVRLIDALKYAPDSYLWLVDVPSGCHVGKDKLCGSSRTYLSGFNAEKLLREFARKQALINIEKIKPYCPKKDYETILYFLNTGEGSTAAARSARFASRSAARSASRSAAESAWSAAESAAWSAAESAAWSARSASRSAAESARSAWSARSAAWSAAWSTANDMLTGMVREKTGWDI